MTRILVAVGVVLLLTTPSLAQFYCDQVMRAIAVYGYEAARQHAMTHYGREAVEAGDRCVRERYPSGERFDRQTTDSRTSVNRPRYLRK
jgi:hypothetical protein